MSKYKRKGNDVYRGEMRVAGGFDAAAAQRYIDQANALEGARGKCCYGSACERDLVHIPEALGDEALNDLVLCTEHSKAVKAEMARGRASRKK